MPVHPYLYETEAVSCSAVTQLDPSVPSAGNERKVVTDYGGDLHCRRNSTLVGGEGRRQTEVFACSTVDLQNLHLVSIFSLVLLSLLLPPSCFFFSSAASSPF